MELLPIAAALFVVYWNGANDNFKGFATVRGIVLSWVATLPLAAGLAWAAAMLVSAS